jgi:CubicO group peptidase (beta-lactamase class C family)
VKEATQYTSGDDQPGYQYQWWMMEGSDTAYLARGLLGQYIFVDPATNTVVVKLSHHPPGNNSGVAAEEEIFLKAVNAWMPSRR